MKKRNKKKRPISAEAIARMATRGEDISRFFTRHLGMVHPLQQVSVDFSGATLAELGVVAKELNISSEVLVRTLVREGLDRRLPRRVAAGKVGSRFRTSNRRGWASGK